METPRGKLTVLCAEIGLPNEIEEIYSYPT